MHSCIEECNIKNLARQGACPSVSHYRYHSGSARLRNRDTNAEAGGVLPVRLYPKGREMLGGAGILQ